MSSNNNKEKHNFKNPGESGYYEDLYGQNRDESNGIHCVNSNHDIHSTSDGRTLFMRTWKKVEHSKGEAQSTIHEYQLDSCDNLITDINKHDLFACPICKYRHEKRLTIKGISSKQCINCMRDICLNDIVAIHDYDDEGNEIELFRCTKCQEKREEHIREFNKAFIKFMITALMLSPFILTIYIIYSLLFGNPLSADANATSFHPQQSFIHTEEQPAMRKQYQKNNSLVQFEPHSEDVQNKIKLYAQGLQMLSDQQGITDDNWYYSRMRVVEKNPDLLDSKLRSLPKPIRDDLEMMSKITGCTWPPPDPNKLPQEGVELCRVNGMPLLCPNMEENLIAIARTGGGKSQALNRILAGPNGAFKNNHNIILFHNNFHESLMLDFPKLIVKLGDAGPPQIPQLMINPFCYPDNLSTSISEMVAINTENLGSFVQFQPSGKRLLKQNITEFVLTKEGMDYCLDDLVLFYKSKEPNWNSIEHNMWERGYAWLLDLQLFLGKSSRCTKPHDINGLASKNLLVLLPDRLHPSQMFIISKLFVDFLYTRNLSHLNNKKLLFVIEEGQNLFPYRSNNGETGVFDDLIKYGRKMGLGFCITSHTTRLSFQALNSFGTIIAKPCSSYDDIKNIAHTCNLTQKQAEDFSNFGPENGIVKISGYGTYKGEFEEYPFLDVDMDEELRKNREIYESLETQPEFKDGSAFIRSNLMNLTDAQEKLLEYLFDCRLKNRYMAMRLEAIEISQAPRNTAHTREDISLLLQQRYISFVSIKYTKGVGRPENFYTLETKAYEWAKRKGIEVKPKNRPRLDHEICQHLVWAYWKSLNRENIAIVEKGVKGLNKETIKPDVYVLEVDSKKPIYYEMFFSNTTSQKIAKIKNINFDEVDKLEIVTKTTDEISSIKKEIKRHIPKEIMANVFFEPINKYGDSVWGPNARA